MSLVKAKRLLCHLVWLFLIGAVLGFVLETGWHYLKNGILINKQGLWYGPFKPIYGLGLVLITLLLYRFKDKNPIWLFIIGIIIGTIFEYFASLFQEVVFGTYTWTYQSFDYNINGRIYLPYTIIWGALAFLWMHYGYKWYIRLFNRYYNQGFLSLSVIILVFIIYDASLTWVITDRYSKRAKGIEGTTIIDKYVDEKFPNEVVKEKFPKLRVK